MEAFRSQKSCSQSSEVFLFFFFSNYSGSRNKAGLNCMVPFMCWFFSTKYMLQCYWIRRWLNPQMQNCIYKGPIVELNSDFGLCKKAGTPKVPCCEQQGQLYLCWFPSAAKINYHKLGALKTTVYYLTALEARGPESGCWRGWCSSKTWGENLSASS